MSSTSSRVFQLQPYGRQTNPPFYYVLITPDPVEQEKVQAAWSYALRYTAQGLDLPDYDAALNLLTERHPSWKIIEGRLLPAQVNLALAEQD